MAKKRSTLKTTKSGRFDNRTKGAKEANFIWDLMVLLFSLVGAAVMGALFLILKFFQYFFLFAWNVIKLIFGSLRLANSIKKTQNKTSQFKITTEPPSLGGFFDCSAYPHEDTFEVSCGCIHSH